MHKILLSEIVKTVRQRYEEGDCPTISRPFGETLEDAVLGLASEVDRLTPAKAENEDQIKSCANCNQVHEKVYSNGGKLCFGIVNVPFRACDMIRTCRTYDNGRTFLEDLAMDEATEALCGLSAAINALVAFTYKRPCDECDKKESDCGGAAIEIAATPDLDPLHWHDEWEKDRMERDRAVGALGVLVHDGVISSGRMRELLDMDIYAQRQELARLEQVA